MPESVIHRSRRFAKAARAERDRLARRRSQIFKKRQSLQGKVDQLDAELEAVEQEIGRLDDLAGASSGVVTMRGVEDDQASVLSGAAIRILAVPLLLREQGTAPIHYRAWLELLTREGYAVAGKRPDAVFLNQVVRSPLVHGTTKAGYYEIDPGVVDFLREKLRKQKSELAEFMREAPREIGEAFEQHRENQRELNTTIARTERELGEAASAIEAWQALEGQSAETLAA
jgi:DNA repair exonuclease SbcCD ATPase subunit